MTRPLEAKEFSVQVKVIAKYHKGECLQIVEKMQSGLPLGQTAVCAKIKP